MQTCRNVVDDVAVCVVRKNSLRTYQLANLSIMFLEINMLPIVL